MRAKNLKKQCKEMEGTLLAGRPKTGPGSKLAELAAKAIAASSSSPVGGLHGTVNEIPEDPGRVPKENENIFDVLNRDESLEEDVIRPKDPDLTEDGVAITNEQVPTVGIRCQ